MTSRRRIVSHRNSPDPRATSLIPAQDDEEDIIEEVGAELDQESGNLVADEEKIRKVGAVDTASVMENRRIRSTAGKKRGGEKVLFNSNDLLTSYDAVLLSGWPPNSFDITMRRLTGTPVTNMITNRPRSGAELYEAIRVLHGAHEEAEYEIVVKDSTTKQFRINGGRITMPDTRPAAQLGQQPMSYQQNGNGAPPPGYYPPQQAAPAPQQPVAQAVAPQDLMAMMTQMFELVRKMQTATPSAQPPQPQFVPQPVMPLMPSPQAGPAEMMAWMTQMLEMLQKAQGQQQPAQMMPPPQPYQPQPAAPNPMEMMSQFFDMFTKMQTSVRDLTRPDPGSYRGPRAFDPRGEQPPPYARPPYAPGSQTPPQREKTAAEHFRETVTMVRTAADAVQEMRSLFPGDQGQEQVTEEPDDDSPVKFVETGIGKMKLAFDKTSGSLRWAETGMTALPGVLQWIGEQREAIQKGAAERQQRQQQPRQQLREGYVEVTPGYRPPPGFVAVPVDEQDLPPPPEHVPPPIQEPPPASRQTWGAPTIPDEEPEQQ